MPARVTTYPARLQLLLIATVATLLVASWFLTQERVLYRFDSAVQPEYESPLALEDGGELQRVRFQRGEEALALGVRSYPNPLALGAAEWLRANWDGNALIELVPIRVRGSDGVRVLDASRWLSEREGESDFPVIAVLAVGARIVVIDRVNGVEVEEALALEVVAGAPR